MEKFFIFLFVLFASVVFCDVPFPGRGVNLGDWLEAPKSEFWGVSIDSADFVNISQKGFKNIRIPARFSDYITNDKRVSSDFMQKVKWAIDQTVKNGMTAIIDVHHFEEMATQPEKYFEILKNIWEDISQEFVNYDDSSVLFELMNEPHDATSPGLWNVYVAELVKIIRQTNKTRPILLGTADWGGFSTLKMLEIPKDDNLIVTLHYYNPMKFTHQGADWEEGANAWLGTRWTGTAPQRMAMKSEFQEVADYAKKKNLKIHIGEFGAFSKGKYEDRTLWTEYVAMLCNHFGFAFSYWEYCAPDGFWIFDKKTGIWFDELVSALFSNKQVSDDADFRLGENLILDPNFENTGKYWDYGVWNKNGVADFQKTDSGFSVNVTKIPAEYWEIQVIYGNLPLKAGKSYLLSFDVGGDGNMIIGASISTEKDYDSWGEITVNVPAKNVKAIIEAGETKNSVYLAFNLGYTTGKAVISNVSIKEIIADVADNNIRQKKSVAKNSKVFIAGNTVNAKPFAEFEIISANGKIIFSGKCDANGKTEIKNLPKGIYAIKMKNSKAIKFVRK